MLDEVRRLAARGLDPTLPAMKAHGVPWLIRHLGGELSLDEATAGAVMDTRRYAKRQLTWFRNQMKDWPWHTGNCNFFTKEPVFCVLIGLIPLDRAAGSPYKPAQ